MALKAKPRKTVEVLSFAGDRYEPHGYFEHSDTVTSPTFSDLDLPVNRIFE